MNKVLTNLSRFIFWSRWLQAPLYVGLIIALAFYAVQFSRSLFLLVTHLNIFDESAFMLHVLDLIDVVMIANLLIMVIIGGYETFVTRMRLHSHPDHPEWLDEVNAGTMKIKLALALIGISSIHLLKTFLDPSQRSNFTIMWQVVIHMTLVFSALFIAYTNKLTSAVRWEKFSSHENGHGHNNSHAKHPTTETHLKATITPQ